MKMGIDRKLIGNKLTQVEVIAAVLLILLLSLFLFKAKGITGFVSYDFAIQDLDMTIDRSQSYVLTSGSEKPFDLTSFKLGGEVLGDGVVEVYLDNGKGQELLVFRNSRAVGSGMQKITGMAVEGEEPQEGRWLLLSPMQGSASDEPPRRLPPDEEPVSGVFSNECGDTCFISMELSNELSYELIFRIEPGTVLGLDNIIYTIDMEEE